MRLVTLIVVSAITGAAAQDPHLNPLQRAEEKETAASPARTAGAARTASPARTASTARTDLSGVLRWRNVGPFRGGRTRAICGVPSQPNVFYMAQVNGGVWKTDDYGRTWRPIFDDQPTGSVGAIAVAVSNPNIIYVGSGEGLHRPDLSVGDGVYKSLDTGKTWEHLGLRDGQQIAQIAVDPRNPDRLFVAVAGHPYGPNTERGIFRSVDGGKSFERVLFKDENVGGADVVIDPANPDTVYASLWESREGPWENSSWNGPGGGIFKSVDGGKTWTQLNKGLPAQIVQANLAIAPSSPRILMATVTALNSGSKIYRSEDAGESWHVTTDDARPGLGIGGGDLPVLRIDPKDPNTVYSATIVCWKSVDGGKSWSGWRGAPGGDDYQNVWINPNDSRIILLGSDQGAIVTVNGGESWSSWYNQPTAQLYHVSADNAFPYRLYSGQQESGSVGISTRGADGAITFRDWHPVAAEEYGYVVADPLDPDIVYGGKLSRYDRRTVQAQDILPVPLRTPQFRMIRTQPIVFSPHDPHLLFFAGNTLWQTRDRGQTWQQISPDLTRTSYELPASIGKYRSEAMKSEQKAPPADSTDERGAGGAAAATPSPVGRDSVEPSPSRATESSAPDSPHARESILTSTKQRGVIYTIAPSPLDAARIWVGTDDGLIHLTTDGGKSWKNVTPPALSAWQKVSILDAGRFDPQTAYAAINTLRLDDNRPHIYRTRDGGQSWQEIVHGIPDGQTVNVVREDPKRKGLLFAGTERGVYFSLDDGDTWLSLRLNMPASSIRDLIIKDDDLAVATHGRGFWVLDNITPLRQVSSSFSVIPNREDIASPARTEAVHETATPLERSRVSARDDNKASPAPSVSPMLTTLIAPQTAWRVRWNTNTDTPLPPDEPAGENPPDGAMIDYYLATDVSGAVTLEIQNRAGETVRRYASDDKPVEPDEKKLRIPPYWIRPPQILSAAPGWHRFLWDMHYTPVPKVEPEYPMTAVYRNTPLQATGPWALPGSYTVVLTTNGQRYTRPLALKMDPRMKISADDLQAQFDLSKKLYDLRLQLQPIGRQFDTLVEKLAKAKDGSEALKQPIEAFMNKLRELGPPNPRPGAELRFDALSRVTTLFGTLQDVDAAPRPVVRDTVAQLEKETPEAIAKWQKLIEQDFPALADQLRAAGIDISLEQ